MKGYKSIKSMVPNITNEKAFAIVAKFSTMIERDEPFHALGRVSSLDKDLDILDLTGRYRLMSELLTD